MKNFQDVKKSTNMLPEKIIQNYQEKVSRCYHILSELEKSISNSNSSSTVEFDSGQPKGCHIFGKIKFVQFGGDYKVRMVDSPNLKVKYVSYETSTQGNWQIVDYGEDYKIELVQAGEDFSVQIVDFGKVVIRMRSKL